MARGTEEGREPAGAPEAGGAEPSSFEEAMTRLERIVQELENGQLALEDSIARFQEGILLAKWCREQLDRAEQRIEVLLQQDGGGWESRPLEEE
ncbi:MAG: exodeoxyribonuclease VII small subunit [Alicyclobacillaceae bacterium]|nr:exodeoxyribonuclease VII small subunit [Alicyclobacillaceae bacterium]